MADEPKKETKPEAKFEVKRPVVTGESKKKGFNFGNKEKKEEKKEVKKEEKVAKVEVKEEKKKEDKPKKKSGAGSVVKGIILLIVVVALVILFLGFYNWNLVSQIYKANRQTEVGNNYRITTTTDGFESVQMYKDGVGVYKTGENQYIWIGENETYMVFEASRQYMKLQQDSVSIHSTITTIPYTEILAVDSEMELFRKVLFGKIQIHTEGDQYVVTSENETIRVNKDDLMAVEDTVGEKTYKVKIETNVVTDEDVKLPNLSTYTNIQLN